MAYCGQRGRVLKGGSTSPRPCNRDEPDSAAAGVRGMKRDHEEQPGRVLAVPRSTTLFQTSVSGVAILSCTSKDLKDFAEPAPDKLSAGRI
jgi:hypothetical protein